MNKFALLLIFLINTSLFAQKNCEYSTNVKDSLGTYRSTKEYMIYEKNFAGNKSYIFFSLVATDGTPTLNLQLIQKSKYFMKAKRIPINNINNSNRAIYKMFIKKIKKHKYLIQLYIFQWVKQPALIWAI